MGNKSWYEKVLMNSLRLSVGWHESIEYRDLQTQGELAPTCGLYTMDHVLTRNTGDREGN